jgi:hypothetical protein
VLAAVLALALAFQLLVTRAPDVPASGIVPNVAVPAPVVSGPVFIPTILQQRPMFTPGNLARAAPGGAGPAPLPLGGAVATGTVSISGHAVVVMQSPDGSIVRLRPGSRYKGWTLTAIAPTGAKFRRGTESMTLGYGAAAQAAPQAEPSEDTTQ